MNGFESREASEIIEVPERNFRYWATSRAFIPEEDAVGRQGIRRKYSFKNLVEGAIISDLVKLNVSVPQAAAAVSRLQGKNFMSASFCFLIITADGKIKVITEDDVRVEQRKRAKAIEIPNKLLSDYLRHEVDQRWTEFFMYMFAEITTMESAVIVPVHKIKAKIERRVSER